MQGGSEEAWSAHLATGSQEDELLEEAARALPPESAKADVRAVADAVQQESSSRAGVCWDPEEQAAWGATKR